MASPPPALVQAALDAVLGCEGLVAAITAHVHSDDDLLAWALVCRAFREAQVAVGRRLITRVGACGGSVERASWAHGLGAPIRGLQRGAASCGSAEVLRWSVEEALRQGMYTFRGETEERELCKRAARSGSVEALAFLRGVGCAWDRATCTEAAQGGHLSVLQWVRGQDPPCPWDEATCTAAAAGGHLSVLQWARGQDPPCPWDAETCTEAARGGHLSVLQWVRGQDPPCPWDEATCTAAAAGGHLSVLQWARGQHPPCPWDGETWAAAVAGGHLSVWQWARGQHPPCPWDAATCTAAVAGVGQLLACIAALAP